MSLTAHIPVRLRIDPALAGVDIEAVVRAAVGAAVGRSLAAFESEVVAERGAYARPHFQAPSFQWSGRPVNAQWRQALDAACVEEIAALTRPIAERVEARLRAAPPVIPANPSERFDPARARGEGYWVPSYDGDVPAPDVPLSFAGHDEAMALVPDGMHYDWWEAVSTDGPAIYGAADAAIAAQFGSSRPDRFAIMYWATDLAMFVVQFLRTANHRPDGSYDMAPDGVLQVQDNGTRFVTRTASTVRGSGLGFRPVGGYNLLHYGVFTSAVEFRALVLRRMYERNGLSLVATAGEAPAAAQLRTRIEDYASAVGAGSTLAAGTYYILNGSGQSIGVPRATSLGDRGSTEILPIAAMYQGATAGEPSTDEFASRIARGETGEGSTGAAGTDGEDGQGEPDGSATGTTSFRYPMIVGGEAVELDLGPFMGEPSLDQLGQLGDAMRRLIQRIAFRLAMPTGDYCGAFLIAAAQMMRARGHGVGVAAEQLPQATRVVPAGGGNLGIVDMQPEITPAVRLMRYLGGTCPLISQLTRLMTDSYRLPGIMAMVTGHRHNDWAGWTLDFLREHTPAMEVAVAAIFQRTCQIMMLQLLRSSQEEISNRIRNFDEYFPRVEALVTGVLGREAELMGLRSQLQDVMAMTSPGVQLDQAVSTWREARQLLSGKLSDQALTAAALTSPGRLFETRGALEHYADGWKVRDSAGRLWTMDELETNLAMRHQTAASIDPLIHQFNDIPAVAATFRDSPHLARGYLFALLYEMRTNNEDITAETISDDLFAFQSGRIVEDLPRRTVPGCEVAMQGIHLMAHEAIGGSFQGNHWYGDGLDYAFDVELGKQSIRAFAETVSVLTLSVLCPPLGIALGVVVAGVHYSEAAEREQLYGSLIDPEALMSRAEVEFEMFMAQFELALSIIPDIGAIARGASSVGRAGARGLARGGMVMAGRTALRRVQRELLASFARQARAGLVHAFVTTVLIDRVFTLTLPHILGPVMEEVNREITVLTGGNVAPRDSAALAAAIAASYPDGLPQAAPDYAAMSPEEAELVRRLEEYQDGERDESLRPASEAP